MRDTEKERERHRQREKQVPCREPDVGLDPGSRITPWAEGGVKPLNHPGCPELSLLEEMQFTRKVKYEKSDSR